MGPTEPRQSSPLKLERDPILSDEASTPSPPSVSSSKKSIKGFADNLMDDGFESLKGMGDAILLSWPRAIRELYRIGVNAKWLASPDIASNIGKELGVTAGQIGDALVAPYAKAAKEAGGSVLGTVGNALYERPVGTLVDALTLYDLGAGSIAGVGKMTGARGLVEAAERARTLPARMLGDGIDKAAGTVGVDLPKIRETLKLKGEALNQARYDASIAKRQFENALKTATPEEKAIFDDLVERGGMASQLNASPKTSELYNSYSSFLKTEREAGMKGYRLADEDVFAARIRKQVAASMGITEDEAAKLIANAEVKPLYKPTETELRSGKNFMESFEMPSEKPKGDVPFLKRFTGKNPLSKDPAKWIPRVIDAWYGVKGNADWVTRIIQNPELVKGVSQKAGSEAIPSYGIYKKFFEDAGAERAKGVFIGNLIKEHGPTKALQMLLEDEKIKADLAKARFITVDPTVRNILKMEFSRWTGVPGYVLSLYDRALSAFKSLATKYNPHFYSGNAVGDAILSLIHDPTGGGLRMARGMGDVMPPVAGIVSDVVGPSGKVGSFIEMFSEADKAGKAGIIAKETASRLIKTGVPLDQLEAELRKVLPSITDLGTAEVARQQLHEAIAAKVDALSTTDEQLAKLKAKSEKLEKMIQSVGPKPVEIGASAPYSGGATKRQLSRGEKLNTLKAALEQQITNLDAIRTQAIADYEASAIRTGALEKRVPELKAKADMVRPGIKLANDFFGEYVALHPVEQYVFRRMIPFYAFNKAMATLAFKLPFIAPTSAFLWGRYSIMMTSLLGDKELPEYARNWFPMFTNEKGEITWLNLSNLGPFNNLGRSTIFNLPIPNAVNVGEQNPFISLVLQGYGAPTRFRTAAPYGAQVSLHDGAVYEFTPDGKLRQTIPQLPLIKGVAHLFPTVQMAEQLLIPYKMTDRGWLGNPEPILKPDGTVKYPKELWARIARAVGGPTISVRDRVELIRSERMRVKSAFDGLKKSFRTASPEEREYILESAKTYMSGENFGHVDK